VSDVKFDQHLARKMWLEYDSLPDWMTIKRQQQAADLARIVPLLLKRIYYLEKQNDNTK